MSVVNVFDIYSFGVGYEINYFCVISFYANRHQCELCKGI